MTAINAFLTPDAAHMFTDGAAFDEKLQIAGLSSKAFLIPHFPAVVSANGMTHLVPSIYWRCCDVSDFDKLLATFGQVIEHFHKVSTGTIGHSLLGNFTAVVAGWSREEDRPALVWAQNFDSRDALAFETKRATRFVLPAQSDEFDRSILSLEFDPDRPAESGLEIMRAQRALLFSPLAGGTKRHAAGGYCQHTVVTRGSIVTRVLESWPDEVGKVITPAPAATPRSGGFF